MKYLGIYLPKETKENCKTLMTKSKMTQTDGETRRAPRLEGQHCESDCSTNATYRRDVSPSKLQEAFSTELEQKVSQSIRKHEPSQITKQS